MLVLQYLNSLVNKQVINGGAFLFVCYLKKFFWVEVVIDNIFNLSHFLPEACSYDLESPFQPRPSYNSVMHRFRW